MAKTTINQLIYDLKDAFEGKPWYGSALMEILKKIHFQSANQKTAGLYSIANVLQHTINWRIFTVKMLENETSFDIEMNSEADWKDLNIQSQEEWQTLVDNFQRLQNRLIELLKTKTDDFLKGQVPNRNYDFYFLINGLLQHDIYHFGQITLISKIVQNDDG